MDIKSLIVSLQRNAHAHGYLAAMHDLTVRSINACAVWKNFQCVVIRRPDPQYTLLPRPFRYVARVDRATVLSWTAKAENRLSEEFVHTAFAKGDACHAILDGDVPASYGWYSPSSTLLVKELEIQFSAEYIYMYKGFTPPAYRGQRLHAFGMTHALAWYLAAGYKGLVSCVEATNLDSLKSCYRMGYQPCGRIRAFKAAGKYFIQPSAECRECGMRLHPVQQNSVH